MSQNIKKLAIKNTFPLAISAIPFGIVMGTSTYHLQFNDIEMYFMNFTVFAGASQLAFIELFRKNANDLILLISCLLINSRMFLYSLSLFEEFKSLSKMKKLILSFFVIDQTYVIFEANKDLLKTPQEIFEYFLSSGLFMFSFWSAGVFIGFFAGDILPYQEHLDFLVTLAFIGIFGPRLRSKLNIIVFISAILLSTLLKLLPFNLGLLLSTLIGMALGVFLLKRGIK